jgi:ABC-type multidrug transport system fused ATPase/permease subunit
VQRALGVLMQGRTVLAVAHRFSTIAHFDRIIVLRHGRVAEDGTLEELVRKNSIFAAMWRAQMGDADNRHGLRLHAGGARPSVAASSGDD